MEDGPWAFRGDAVILAEYDGFTKPSMVKLDKLAIWAQIHDFPDGYVSQIPALAAKIGDLVYAEPASHDFEGNFFKVRVNIDVNKPLKNAASLKIDDKRLLFRVKYERLPDWCAVCGRLGHLYKEHGDGVHPPSALVFKNLKATWFHGAGPGPGGRRTKKALQEIDGLLQPMSDRISPRAKMLQWLRQIRTGRGPKHQSCQQACILLRPRLTRATGFCCSRRHRHP